MKTAFLTFEQFHGKKNIGSSKIRCHWLIENWLKEGKDIGNAEVFKIGKKYDCIIFQKAYWIEYAKVFKGIKILDLCDPDWLNWPYEMIAMINEVDGITTSTEALANSIAKFTDKPVWYLADRVNLDLIKPIKKHKGNAKTVVWYGYSQNFEMLQSAIHAIKKEKLNLIVISNKPFSIASWPEDIELTNFFYNEEHVYQDIAKADIVINPISDSAHWKYKSNNKTVIAWALGMPVAANDQELKKFIPEEARIEEVNKRLKEVEEKYDVKLSVKELKNIIIYLSTKKNQKQTNGNK